MSNRSIYSRRKSYRALWSLGSLVFTISSCIPRDDCPAYFEIPLKISSIQEEYRMGDTLTFISSFPKEVEAFTDHTRISGDFYNMSGYRLPPVAFLYRIDTIESESTLSKYFDYIENPDFDFQIYQYSDGSTGLEGEYSFQRDSFLLIYQLIARHPGIFVGEFGSNILPGGIQQQDFPGKCRGVDISAWTRMNSGFGNNIHLLKASPNPHWNTWALVHTITHFHHFGSFAFKIVP